MINQIINNIKSRRANKQYVITRVSQTRKIRAYEVRKEKPNNRNLGNVFKFCSDDDFLVLDPNSKNYHYAVQFF